MSAPSPREAATPLDETGAHARSAVGVAALPLNAPVELVVTFATGR